MGLAWIIFVLFDRLLAFAASKNGLPARLNPRDIYAYGICGNCGAPIAHKQRSRRWRYTETKLLAATLEYELAPQI